MHNPDLDPGDGFARAAGTLRSHAKNLEDQPSRDAFILAAEKFEDVDKRAHVVFAEIEETIERNKKWPDSILQKRFTHRTWEFWAVVGVIALVLCFVAYAK